MKILVAYDGSPLAEAAVDLICDRPWPEKTEARLVMVVEPPYAALVPPDVETEIVSMRDIGAQLRKRAERLVRDAVARVRARGGIEASGEVRDGRAKQVLLDAIQEWQPDLVLAGSHGYTAAERLVLGSVSYALVTHAPCNVEVVKTGRRSGTEARR